MQKIKKIITISFLFFLLLFSIKGIFAFSFGDELIKNITSSYLQKVRDFSIGATAQFSSWYFNTQSKLLRPINTVSQVVIGDTSTTSATTILEVKGTTLFRGGFNATSTSTSTPTFHTNELCIANDCKTVWPTGGASAWEKYTGLSSPANIITPTTTNASIYISGNATTTQNLQVAGVLATGTAQPNSTTTANFGGNILIQGIATTTGNFAVSSTTAAEWPTFFVNSLTGKVGIGTASMANSAKFQVKSAKDENFAISGHLGIPTGVSIHAYNDAETVNVPMEFRASSYGFNVGNVGILDMNPVYALTVGNGDCFGVSSNGIVYHPSGQQTLPSISFTADTDTGIWSSGANTLNFSIGGTEKFKINSTGNVGIGITNPTSTLSVLGDVDFRGNGTTTGNLIVGASAWAAPTSTLTVNGSTYIQGNSTTTGNVVIGGDGTIKPTCIAIKATDNTWVYGWATSSSATAAQGLFWTTTSCEGAATSTIILGN